jgi:aldehyde dehydrogenase (NAD+)
MAAGTTSQTRQFTTHQEFEDAYHLLFKTFATRKTKSLEWRKWQLKQLWWMIDDNEKAITDALSADLWRHEMESLASDILGLKTDILEHIEHLEEWAADERPENAGLLFGRLGNARVRKEPLGVSLVIGAWNFPFLLTFQPVIAAVAAGCCVLIKPSELAVASEQLMANLVEKYLDQSAIRLVTGGPEETTRMLEYKFNQIFFTGSSKIARFVALAAAKHLTPTVLELGGQGPAIVTRSANLDLAAKRVAYAKFLNAGQICLSVNHVFVDPAVHDEFVRLLGKWIDRHSASAPGQKPSSSSRGKNGDMCKIINQRNYDRLASLLGKTKGKVACGGHCSAATGTMSLTVVTDVTVDGKPPQILFRYDPRSCRLARPNRQPNERGALRTHLTRDQGRLSNCDSDHKLVRFRPRPRHSSHTNKP